MAKIEDYQPMTEGEIVKALDVNIRSSVGYFDSHISREREQAMEYYNSNLPKPHHSGNSKYVSNDVFQTVEALKAALLEVFAAGNKIVQFTPQGPEDVENARIASEYVDYVMFRQNEGFDVFASVIHDGLMARAGVARVYWMRSSETDTQSFENLTEGEYTMLIAQDNVEPDEYTTDALGLYSGTVLVERDTSRVCVEAIAPEEFVIEPRARDLESAKFCAYRCRKTLSELREEGFDEELIQNIGEHEDVEYESDPEVIARFNGISDDRGVSSEGYQDQVRSILVYEAYIELDVEGEGTTNLYRVIKAGNSILDIEVVDRRPFISFVPMPIPHSFYGSNFAHRVIPTQNARTVLTRSILDHAVLTNNPRYMVTKGGLTNPRELIDNRIGGLVNVTRPDAIAALPQAPLNPFTFQTISMLDEEKEDTTGVSRLSQGLSKDAVSKQNSAAMVEQLATLSMQRQKIIARHFANQFVRPLFVEIYRLVLEYEDRSRIMDVAGNWVEVDPTGWIERRNAVVDLKLGYGEQDREAQKYLQYHALLSQDPSLQPMYQPNNRYQLIKAALEKAGIMNVADFLTNPEDMPPPQPDPAAEIQMQLAMKQMELQERQTQLGEFKAQSEAERKAAEMELQAAKMQSDYALKSDAQDLKEEALDAKVRKDEHDMAVDAANVLLKGMK